MPGDDGSSLTEPQVVEAVPTKDDSPPAKEELTTLQVYTKNLPLICKLGAGFFADAYDMFVIDIVLAILSEMQEEDPTGLGMDASTKGLVASATSIGAVAGMLFFGVVGDQVGRRIGILCTGAFVALGAVCSACIQRSTTFSLAHQLFVCRLVLGFGIGGEYPLSAAMASERSDNATRGRITTGVFSMQGLGMIFAAVLPLILLYAGCPMEICWRVLVCFTVVPSLTALYLRLGMKESAAFKEQQARKKKNKTSFSTQLNGFLSTLRVYLRPLIGTMMAWLCMDVTFYGTGEFKHSVSAELFPNGSGEQAVIQDAWFALVVSLLALPGYICACWFIDILGRWKIQVLGFCMMCIFYVVMAICTQFNANKYLNLIIFGITFFWTNFGPNTTSYVIPSEIYPTSVKTTCHGMSAASGKLGAIIGSFIFPTLQTSIGLAGVMYVCTGVAALGLIITLIFLPKKLVEAAAKGIFLITPPTLNKGTSGSASVGGDMKAINSSSSSVSTVSVDGVDLVRDIEEGRGSSQSTSGYEGSAVPVLAGGR
ncbi:inorganic phosphate transporter, putative [Perkinsus marinus ATCC 50983]|uniref:Inorganic phosphate transporter, putative n=1 Tax=Perkinsus marinus (strain ATCC 50983 / TXsc) TaxID=423536 RepID=C5LQR2_PERM5|nr:inorganic phosphate transporter, putative [Perkinsus marinus ATCC 50983]EER00797.1 inorganic phosphate transporter, putative [Perkinsus marinus ATCC 50983]|eukprot:XP_002768079.1 inorganic phosphate transporter, putative [Perkinsus marinus ATCC 50983]